MSNHAFRSSPSTLLLLALGLTALPSLANAAPQLAFDSFDGGNKRSFRGAGSAPGATITVEEEVTITRIAVLNDMWVSSDLKFLVFNKTTHELLYVSAATHFVDDGETWKMSNPLAVTLAPGVEYEIGAVGNTIVTWNFDEMATKTGSFASTGVNPNFFSFSAPHVLSHGAADAAVRLYVDNPDCGDGILDLGEECDDGDASNTDDCLDNCVAASCGDGFTWVGHEECDDGNASNSDACLTTCVDAICGDGHLWAGEETCDDANEDNTDLCTNACNAAKCGDGYAQPGEACDDGNHIDNDSCSNECVPDTCGNGNVEGDEECDDSNDDNSDGCTNACTLPACGDGQIQEPESCDDGNPWNDDACLNDCVEASCGDGYINEINEECDDANDIANDGCTNTCKLPTCGDGIVQGDEECDDGNDVATDACNNMCAMTPGTDDTGTDTGTTTETSTDTGTETGTTTETGTDTGEPDEDGAQACSCSAAESPLRGALGTLALLALLGPLGLRRRRG